MAKLTRYEGPTEVIHRLGHLYLYDSGTGTLIAEIDPAVAQQIAEHPDRPRQLTYDGRGHVHAA